MATYEEKLTAFARGKKLLRLPRPLRNRADAFCDACGSTRPRTLCALKDLESGRYYFAGATCLKELANHGVILRRFGKESAQAAYEKEMQLRFEKIPGNLNPQECQETALEQTPSVVTKGDSQRISLPADMISHPAVFMIQYPDHYGAFVSISTDQRGVRSWGYAEEERWEEKWSRGGERGLVLEKTKAERVEAARLCLVRAYHVACSPLENSGRKPSAGGQSNGNDQIGSLPDSFRALVDLADRAAVKARK